MDSKATRLVWAAVVAVLSACAIVAIASSSSGGPERAGAGTSARQAMSPQRMQEVASRVMELQRRDGAAVPGVSEPELRAFETATLGSAHASDHAENRAAERENPGAMAREYREVKAASIPSPGPASKVGKWGSPFAIPTFAVHATLLPTGEVLWFSYENFANGSDANRNTTQAFLWNPASGQSTKVNPPVNPKTGKPFNIWCSGHTLTEDGRVAVFGGTQELLTDTSDYKGLNKVFTFNPWTKKWVAQPDMRHGRWYPSAVRLPDGKIPILSGLDEFGGLPANLNRQVELFTPSAASDGVGRVDLIGETLAKGETNASKPPTGEYYPHLFSMASGRMLVAGPERQADAWFMDSHTNSSFTWKKAADASVYRLWGNAVPLASNDRGPSRVMAIGGADYFTGTKSTPLKSTEVFDENAGSNQRGAWTPGPSLNVGRAHANAVVLPDGSVAEVGGGIGTNTSNPNDANGGKYETLDQQRQVELWNPTTNTWTLGPAQSEPRAYHSTALLLPDGRVISAGDDRLAKKGKSDVAEIYEPPYLHQGGTRPEITAAPTQTALGSDFGITSTSDVKSAALVAPGSVTHAVDMNQRYLPLTVKRVSSNCLNITAPPTANAAPPGYYMLFLLDSRGVPSVAKFVRLTAGGTATACPQTTPDPDPGTTDPDPGTTPEPDPGGGSTDPGTGGTGGGGNTNNGTGTQTPRGSSPPFTPSAVPVKPKPRGAVTPTRRKLKLKCGAAASPRTRTCRITLRERLRGKRTRTIATGTATLRPGRRSVVVTITLSSATMRQLAKRRTISVWMDVRITARGVPGAATGRKAYKLKY